MSWTHDSITKRHPLQSVIQNQTHAPHTWTHTLISMNNNPNNNDKTNNNINTNNNDTTTTEYDGSHTRSACGNYGLRQNILTLHSRLVLKRRKKSPKMQNYHWTSNRENDEERTKKTTTFTYQNKDTYKSPVF